MDDTNSEQQFRVFRDFDFLDVELEDGEVRYSLCRGHPLSLSWADQTVSLSLMATLYSKVSSWEAVNSVLNPFLQSTAASLAKVTPPFLSGLAAKLPASFYKDLSRNNYTKTACVVQGGGLFYLITGMHHF